MIPFVDEELNTAATDNKIKYLLTHEDGTTEIVQLNLYTPVETEGTELNKVYFDSIDSTIHEPTIKQSSSAEFTTTTPTEKTITLNSSGRRYVQMTIRWAATSGGGNYLALFDIQTNRFIYYAFIGSGSSNKLDFDVTNFQLYYSAPQIYVNLQSAVYNNGNITVTLKGTKHNTQGNITVTIKACELDGYKEA